MLLKKYQSQALDSLSDYLKVLADEHKLRADELDILNQRPPELRARMIALLGEPVAAAWKLAQERGIAASPNPWRPLKDGVGRSIPHVCLKLPTGGGKTLVAAHALERVSVDYFGRSTGLVLWIVPSEAIYTQTKKQLTNRESAVRQTLDRMSGGRVKILEKLDAFTKQDTQDRLCVLLLMLPSANRHVRNSLRMFRDSGRYESFFKGDDTLASQALLDETPNLETFDLAEAANFSTKANRIKDSLGNVLRIARPIVVLDEGHHTYGDLARSTLSEFNPRFILELTATPEPEFSNILVSVPGMALKDAEMIKLPIELVAEENRAWKKVLEDALVKLNALQKAAERFHATAGPERYIRPIMLVRVDLTGREQRGRAGELVHSEDVFNFLTQTAGLREEAVRRHTAELKELKEDDLLSDTCPVRVIITKDALREGWDCPFAYVLAVLSGGTARTALTQMIGRVLRQPQAEATGVSALDRAYVFCKDVAVGKAIDHIRNGLEKEGMADLAAQIETGGGGGTKDEVQIRFRKGFRGTRIMVPRVLHREGKRGYRDLEFERDILPEIDWNALSWRGSDTFAFADYDVARREIVELDFARTEKFDVAAGAAQSETVEEERLDRPVLVRRMLDVIPNPWQGMRILDEALRSLQMREDTTEEKIAAVRYQLIDAMLVDLRKQVDVAAKAVFQRKVHSGDIVFKLLAAPFASLNYKFDEVVSLRISEGDSELLRSGFTDLQRSLYNKVFKSQMNTFEQGVALYVDGAKAVEWWWRIVARQDWHLQGWRPHKVYPDFLIKLESEGDHARMLVLETKGKHLDNEDTKFKRELFEVLEAAYVSGKEAGDVELFTEAPEAMKFSILLQQDGWKAELQKDLA